MSCWQSFPVQCGTGCSVCLQALVRSLHEFYTTYLGTPPLQDATHLQLFPSTASEQAAHLDDGLKHPHTRQHHDMLCNTPCRSQP